MKENGPPATRIAPGPRAAEALQSWAIHRASSPIEQMLWSKRGVEIFDVDLDEFAANLSHRAAIGHVCGVVRRYGGQRCRSCRSPR